MFGDTVYAYHDNLLERMMVHIHYLAHIRLLYSLACILLYYVLERITCINFVVDDDEITKGDDGQEHQKYQEANDGANDANFPLQFFACFVLIGLQFDAIHVSVIMTAFKFI